MAGLAGRFFSAALSASSFFALMVACGPSTAAEQTGAWAERVQIVYQPQTRSVVRKMVRVWDFHPEMNLDFTWEPAGGAGQSPDATIAADGTVSGRGRLVWRVRGSASYDPKTVYSSYTGALKDGRPDGEGRLEIRSGEVFEGQWKAGLLDGSGMHVDAEGNRYEGQFAAGIPSGKGRLLSKTGEIFTGTFADGLKDGIGTTRLPGGTTYESRWAVGRELGGGRPDVLADAKVGGLIKAQSGGAQSGGDAGKVEIGVSVDQRMTQQADMQYQHLVRDEDIAIYPVSDSYNEAWNGNGTLTTGNVYDGMDWENAPSFAEVDLKTTDGSRVKLDSLEMKVASSEAYRKPMLSIVEHRGCTGFRPDFSIVNNGWGDAKGMKMSVRFSQADDMGEPTGEPSRTFTQDIGDFSDGADVGIKSVFEQAGVDVAALENGRFSCPSRDSMNVCRSQVTNKVNFGEIANYVGGVDQQIDVLAEGTLDYSWADDYGNTYQQSEPFRATIALAFIEAPEEMAECGDGFGGSPEALRYQNVEFPIDKHDYAVAMPVRGNKNLSAYTARLKMWSAMSSIHRFAIAAHFADGSTRESKPVTFFYFRPKQSLFETKSTPAACYLPKEVEGCG